MILLQVLEVIRNNLEEHIQTVGITSAHGVIPF